MERIFIIAVGALLASSFFVVETHLDTANGGSKVPRGIRLASDPALKYISEDSPYMRSER